MYEYDISPGVTNVCPAVGVNYAAAPTPVSSTHAQCPTAHKHNLNTQFTMRSALLLQVSDCSSQRCAAVRRPAELQACTLGELPLADHGAPCNYVL